MAVVNSPPLDAALGGAPTDGTWVSDGGQAAGRQAHVLASVDRAEADRRAACGLGALSASLRLLDDLLALPMNASVHTSALPPGALERLGAAPAGCVDIAGPLVTRLARPVVRVAAAVSVADTWRVALTNALAFRPLCRSYVLVTGAEDLHEYVWEAQIAGVGVLARPDGAAHAIETLPAPGYDRPLKPAGWRFAEHAWQAACVA